MTSPTTTKSTRPPMWQLVVFVVIVVVIIAALLLLFLGDDSSPSLETSDTTSSSTTSTGVPTIDGTFGAPPPQDLRTTTTPAPTTTAAPSTTAAPTTTEAPATTTSTTAAPTSTTTAPPSNDPGPKVQNDGDDYEAVQDALDAAVARWNDKGPKDGYTYRTRKLCMCPTRYDNEISVDARGEVRGQRTLAGRAEEDPPTVTDLFARIQKAIDDGDDIEVQFDRKLGFPVRYVLDPDPKVADDETVREIDWVRDGA